MPVRRRRSAATCLAALSLLLAGCASGQDAWVELKGRRYLVEVADSPEERERGLMFRDQMAPDRGMLFIHEAQEPMAYWMKNTRIPLDILYFDQDRRLVSASRNTPPCSAGDRCPPYPSQGPARYVLELNAGQAGQLDLQPGDELVFGPGIPTPDSPP